MGLKFNPFFDSGITTYEQYKKFPFLLSQNLTIIKNRISQEIEQIKNNYFFSERLIILGMRGIGKTSTLFFIKDMLEEAKIQTVFFSRLFEDAEHFEILSGKNLNYISMKPVYILVDFPDSINPRSFKSFLLHLWDIMTHKNHEKINLVFAMNISHYDKSFSYSEILGKFSIVRLEPFNLDETTELIRARLKLAGDVNYFSDDIIRLIYDYSKGIPRNVISACNLLVNASNGKIKIDIARKIFQTEYINQVISDRVEDLNERIIYNQMVEILKNDFGGVASSQEDYVKKVNEKLNISRATILKKISYLQKIGVFKVSRGGYNRIQKIISIE